MKSHKLFILFVAFFGTAKFGYSQKSPSNDLCSNAELIVVSDNGFGIGEFISDSTDITNAKRETAEKCVEQLQKSGNCSKTIWYKFFIGTTRDVSIALKQKDSAIQEIFTGFQIYKTNNCDKLYGNEAAQLAPINKFGLSGNSCLNSGWYMLQVSANQRASGKVWIELNVNFPKADSFDNQASPYLLNKYSSVSYSECNSMEKFEIDSSVSNEYRQTIWAKAIIDSGYNYFEVLLNTPCYFKLFKSQPSISTIQSTPYAYFDGKSSENSIFKHDSKCKSATHLDSFFIMFLTKPTSNNIRVTISKSKSDEQEPTTWNSSLTPDIIDLTKYLFFQSRKSLSCEATLSQSHCAIIPKEFISIVGNDTQRHQNSGYQVITVTDGLLTINYDGNPAFVNIYQGDISKSCNLTFWKKVRLNSSQYAAVKLCIKKGTYTLVYAYEKSIRNSTFLTLRLAEFKASVVHDVQTDPDDLGSFDPSFINKTTDTLNFTKTSSTINLDGVEITGELSFKEIYFSKAGSLTILGANASMYLFEGRASVGAVKKIDGVDYTRSTTSFGYTSSFSFFSGSMTCFPLKNGYYTLVCVNYRADTLPCENQAFFLKFIGHPPCPFINNDPLKAERLNDNKDIIQIATKLDEANYAVTLTGCADCYTTSINTPVISCTNGDLPQNSIYRYYTFSLSRQMSLYIGINTNYALFVGNCVSNPGLVLDSSKRVSSCSGGVYCHLLPNTIYTIVISDNQSLTPPKYELIFSEIRQTTNDFISNSMDLGHFTGSKTIKSQETFISCHTNGLAHEIPFKFNSYLGGTQSTTKFPTTPNTMVAIVAQTTWFTFTAATNTNLILELLDSSAVNYNSLDVFVYRYLGKNDTSWSQTLASGLDSSIINFKQLAYYSSVRNPITLNNESCEAARYFICVFSSRSGVLKSFNLKVNSEQKIYENDGDFCHDAKKIAITKFGDYEVSTYNLCHTYGNSPFEDKPEIQNLASTWFEIDLTSLQSFDMSMSFLGYNTRYNLYAGNCGALTKITFGKSANGYFELPCMGAGKYYVQIFGVFDYRYPTKLGIKIKVKPNVNKGCKPFDFKSPISYFEYTGGCNVQDTLNFTNLSTQGNDMQYAWWLNNQLVSTLKEPKISQKHSLMVEENQISLVVLNNITGLSDTSTQTYTRDTATYFFKLSGPSEAFCFDTVVFKSSTNFSRKLAYEWSESPLNKLYYSVMSYADSLIRFPNFKDRVYYLYAKSENCIFYDSISIPEIKRVRRYFDTTLCQNQVLLLQHDSGVYRVNNVSLSYDGQVYEISTPDTYRIIFNITDYCYYYDTINVSYDYGPRLLTVTDTVYDCNTVITKLSYTKEKLILRLWSTGDTTEFIDVISNGQYSLVGTFSACRSLNYTAFVTRDILNTKQLRDSTVCHNTLFDLSNPYSKDFLASSLTPITNKLIDKDSTLLILKLEKGRCIFNDTAVIRTFPDESMIIDSQYCDTTNNMTLDLDGKNAINYDWFLNGSINRFLRISDYGSYPVARIDVNHCKDTIRYNILNSCPRNVWIPNVFSPNQDFVNDYFRPYLRSEYTRYHISIYNRWGELIYDSNNAWDGKFQGDLVKSGVYGYIISIEYPNDPIQYIYGTVQVIK